MLGPTGWKKVNLGRPCKGPYIGMRERPVLSPEKNHFLYIYLCSKTRNEPCFANSYNRYSSQSPETGGVSGDPVAYAPPGVPKSCRQIVPIFVFGRGTLYRTLSLLYLRGTNRAGEFSTIRAVLSPQFQKPMAHGKSLNPQARLHRGRWGEMQHNPWHPRQAEME